MNDILKAIFDSYEKEKEIIRKKTAANKDIIAALNSKIDSFYSGVSKDDFRSRLNVYKENKEGIKELEKKLATAYENETILNTALRVACEMQVKTAANALRREIISNPEKWCKYPTHFKKFMDMIHDFLNDTGCYFYNSFHSYYISSRKAYPEINTYIFYSDSGMITPEVIKDIENKGDYNIIAASDILSECKKAFKARVKIMAAYEKAKKEIEEIRSPFASCNAFYSILPYANSSPENYKRL